MSFVQSSQNEIYKALSQVNQSFFLRLFSGKEALWISDFPLRSNPEMTEAGLEQLHSMKLIVCYDHRGYWLIEPTFDFYLLVAEEKESLPFLFRSEESALPVFTLMNLLLSHPAEIKKESIEDLRFLLKNSLSENNLSSASKKLLSISALRLRKNEALAYHGGLFLKNHLFSN